ncbi:MAG: replication-relaxation family protein [Candidatus Berkelbacteria bacterium]
MTNSPNITKKQQQILHLLFQFRFLNRPQIQQFLKHKDRRATNDLLSDLANKEYIGRIYIETFPEKTKPAVYYLIKAGVHFLKSKGFDQKQLHKLYYENKRSENFISQSLLLVDVYLDLSNRKDDKAKFTMAIASDYPSHSLGEFLGDLLPSAYIEQESNEDTEHYFLEILPDVPIERLRPRIRKYLDFYDSSEWEGETSEDFPTVIMICPDVSTLIYVKRYLKRKFIEMDGESLIIHLTTIDKFKEHGLTGDIWEKV